MVTRLALTVWQPYATLLVAGVKDVENRGRAIPSTRIGTRLWIHAGKRIVPEEDDRFAWGILDAMGWGIEEIQSDAGRLLGSVIPTGSHDGDSCLGRTGETFTRGGVVLPASGWCSPWADPDAYHWQVSDAVALDDPPEIRGQQGLWRIPEEIPR